MKRILLLTLLLAAPVSEARAYPPVSPPLESIEKSGGLVWPKMRLGSKGFAVSAMQRLLSARGFKTPIDGVFGPETRATVHRFQNARGLKSDGMVGYQTWEALAPTLGRGARGALVRALQTQLNAQGTRAQVDGVFGSATAQAVSRFARGNGMEDHDGRVDAAVWCYLVGGHFDGE